MDQRTVSIRTFSSAGSKAEETAIEEAERILAEAHKRRALVIDEDQETVITEIRLETRNVMIVDPIQGG